MVKRVLVGAQLLQVCGLTVELDLGARSERISPSTKTESGSLTFFEQIGPQLVFPNLPASDALHRRADLGGKLLGLVEPLPNMSLGNLPAGLLGQLSGESPLTSQQVAGLLDLFAMCTHEHQSDKFACLLQQSLLSCADKETGQPYCRPMKREDWTTLSGRLKSAMREAAKDDKAVAEQVSALAKKKISWQTIQGIRIGTTQSSVYIAHIADVLKCNAVWLAVGKGQPYDSQMAMGSLDELTPAAVEVARRWQSLAPNLRQSVYGVLVAFESLAESGAVEQAAPAAGRKPKDTA